MSKKKTTLTAKNPDTISFEEKVKQVAAVLPKDDSLTDAEEFDVITGKGIEYVLKCNNKPDLKIYIAPIKIAQYRLFYELDAIQHSDASIMDKLETVSRCLSEILNVPKEVLDNYVDQDDIVKITTLLSCGILMGRSMFKKNKISLSEAESYLRRQVKASLG